MLASNSVRQVYEFGPFLLDSATSQLFWDGKPVPLEPKVFQTLLILVRNCGRLVERDQLMAEIWPDSFVEDTNLARNISILRKTLGKDDDGCRYIETVPKRGYRFVATVSQPEFLDQDTAGMAINPQRHTQTGFEERVPWKLRAAPPALSEAEPPKTRSRGILLSAHARFVGTRDRIGRGWKLGIGMFVLALALASVAGMLYLRARGSRQAPAPRSIAVLPFKQLGGSESDEYLGLGLADALITRLGNLRGIAVRPTAAAQRLVGDDREPGAIGRALGVDAVLDGRVQRSEGTVRVTVQLVNSKDGSPIWAEKFDEAFTSVFAAQDAVASRVTLRLAPVLTPQERKKQVRHDTDSPEAYEAYLKGRYFWNKRTTESYRKSIDYFRQAIQKDPTFALAYVGLADACAMDAVPEAEPALRKALELDDTLGEAHASFGFYRSFWQMDWAGAEHEFRQAIELSPNYASAHHWYALCLAAQGRFDQAKAEMAQALEIDPLSPNLNADMGQIYYFAREYDAAMAYCEKALEMDPDFAPAHLYLCDLYIEKGMHAQAVEEFLKSGDPRGLQPWKAAYDKSGWRGFLQSVVKTGGFAHDVFIHAQLGNKQAALEDLEKTYDDGYLGFLFIKVSPLFDEIRAEPRFQNLLSRVGLGA